MKIKIEKQGSTTADPCPRFNVVAIPETNMEAADMEWALTVMTPKTTVVRRCAGGELSYAFCFERRN